MLSIHQLLKNIINLKGFLVMYPPVCRQIVYVNYCIGPVEGYNMEMDVEDLLSNPFNTQPPSLNELIHVTGFNKDWIMFMYRNFKQICSNGRMPLQQWRRIFQLIFPKSANSEFADRVFRAIAGGKTSKHITFEELILCLHRISECYCIYASTSSQNSSAHFSRIAQFVFLLMKPSDHVSLSIIYTSAD
uniref:BMA-NCS-6, isoform g n=1 Tax=Brugia malayi TaxID=6279 RepID=A0A1I9G6U9_BRUMA|nr:BMA-NCS-6, isoform g [Brugia malayi]